MSDPWCDLLARHGADTMRLYLDVGCGWSPLHAGYYDDVPTRKAEVRAWLVARTAELGQRGEKRTGLSVVASKAASPGIGKNRATRTRQQAPAANDAAPTEQQSLLSA
jgi:hypothetical protein